jgi:hypothetical protein
MEERPQIHFFMDEDLPARALARILEARGHRATPVQVGLKDPAIMVTAEQEGAVIVTADKWFLRELFRFPSGHKGRFERVGVVQVAGEWEYAERRIRDYLPIVEQAYHLRQRKDDRRLGVDLSQGEVRIVEAKLLAPRRATPAARRPGRFPPAPNDRSSEEE